MQFDKRETILTVSQKLFSRFGLFKTTVDEIAKLARIGKGTVYHYFKSKEEIFAQVVDKESRTLQQKIQEAIANEDTAQAKLAAFVKTRFSYLKQLTNYYNALTDDYLEHYGFIEQKRREFLEKEIATVKKLLDEGVQEKSFDIQNTRLTAQAIVFALKGMEYPWTFEKDILDIENSIGQLLTILFKGIEKK